MATQPLSEIGSIEYFRALKNHNPLKKTTSELNMLNKKEYEIDKLVKKHIKELISSVKSSSCSSFQIEEESDKNKPYTLKDTHMLDSEQISLQNENSENQNFCFKSKLSFNKWLEIKVIEKKLKQHLSQQASAEERSIGMLESSEKHEIDYQHYLKVKEWEIAKRKEEKKRLRQKQKSLKQEEELNEKKKQEGREYYKLWLKDNLKKLKLDIKLKRKEKKTKNQEIKKVEQAKEERKIMAEQAYNRWLYQKSFSRSYNQSRPSKNIKQKKPMMLAYSPNRRRTHRIQENTQERSSKISIPQSIEDLASSSENSQIQSVSVKQQGPNLTDKYFKGQYRLDDYQVFEEMSSIRRSPKVIKKTVKNEESFTSELDEDEVMD